MSKNKHYKWLLLALVVVTNMLVAAIPSMAISVLAEEISFDLGLSLVQIGVVWGSASLFGIVTGLLAGALGDKLGPKKVLVFASLIGGMIGAARGFAIDFTTLTLCMFLFGAMMPFVTNNGFKISGMWFPSRQLGLANGIISMGMALGFLLGSLLSASVLSPLLGGWRNVLILYGVLGSFMSVLWAFSKPIPQGLDSTASGQNGSILSSIAHVAKQKNLWLLGLTLIGVAGGVQGYLGYLPLYLRGQGWAALNADGALSTFHLLSMLFVLPIALWSDRLGSRKRLLMIAGFLSAAGMLLISFAQDSWVWLAVFLSGMVRDGFMAILLTMVVEVDRIGARYAGTATGLAIALAGIGNFLAPPLGNSTAVFGANMPFVFWAGLTLAGLVCLSFVNMNKSKAQVLTHALE